MDWKYVWICKCGAKYKDYHGNGNRFLNFGFNKICPSCGEDIGLHGNINQIRRETIRFVRKKPFRLFDISTWFCGDKMEIKESV